MTKHALDEDLINLPPEQAETIKSCVDQLRFGVNGRFPKAMMGPQTAFELLMKLVFYVERETRKGKRGAK